MRSYQLLIFIAICTTLFFNSCKSDEEKLRDAKKEAELHEAVQKGDLNAVKSLINNEVNIDARDDGGATPLIWASAYGKAEIVKFLISEGSEINASIENGITSLMIATQYGEYEVVSILINSGARVNLKEEFGLSALQIAVNKDNENLTKFLIKKGADIDLRAKDGSTALYKASARGNKSIVDLLLKSGADPNIYLKETSSPPRSPLLIAAWNKSLGHNRYKAVIDQLKKYGARDNWLNTIPGFDPYKFSQLTLSLNKEGTVMVGSTPFFIGRHYAARMSQNNSDDHASGTVSGKIGKSGTNFFSWEDKNNRDMVTILVIEDDKGNSTLGRVLPPVFIGENGVIYRDGVTSINTGGPFVNIIINWKMKIPVGNVFLERKGESIKLQFNNADSSSYMLKDVSKNEAIGISFMDGSKSLYSVDIDCVIRGATSNSVTYIVNYKE